MGKSPRQFSLREANRTLPLVRRILTDIVESYPALQERLEAIYEEGSRPHTRESRARIRHLRHEIDAQTERINGFIRELSQIGCEFKGFEPGLVDFPARYQERPILLCWKLGEPAIEFWHDTESGYAGRQPISAEMAAELDAERLPTSTA
jgi:hypothetical protein